MLDERKEKAITLILSGEAITDVAKLVGVYRSTIYNWLEDEEFKAELDRRRQEIVKQGNALILAELKTYVMELRKMAVKGKSERNRLDALQYLIDRVLGKTTTKVEQIVTEDKDKVNDDILENEFKEVDNE
ncbi:Helix-turn-helix of insertion element transposase [Caloramator quimbayensis]|uniref:Helix-turn-helix of insertion element transposase n=1 Tax=Caloramator quimbayensis TaxID=1147123 RepID=A0A1T4YCH1_9CLOT|nr:helix-turn-helix domain-containing protein [Caloramator quimbayensis]SKA99393.1 Helix-turn-helix of insertion element transposase [Caloramator quimbayensis]